MEKAGELKDIVNAPGPFPSREALSQERSKAVIPSYTALEENMKI